MCLVLESLRYLAPPGNCQTVYDKGGRASGNYVIQPNASTDPFIVYCDFATREGASTNFQHDLSDDIIGQGLSCADPYCLKMPVSYAATMDQIMSVLDTSTVCTQEFRYYCAYNKLSHFGRWMDRNGVYNEYWDGTHSSQTQGCSCSLNYDTSTCDKAALCNCDADVSRL